MIWASKAMQTNFSLHWILRNIYYKKGTGNHFWRYIYGILGVNPTWEGGEWFHYEVFDCLLSGKKSEVMCQLELDFHLLLGMQMLGLNPWKMQIAGPEKGRMWTRMIFMLSIPLTKLPTLPKYNFILLDIFIMHKQYCQIILSNNNKL